MARFDRYMLSQLLILFGFFSLILVSVYWVNRAIGLFDQLIGDGQSARVFLEFTILTLPNVILIVLPISAFVAAVYVTNRLSEESEMVVLQTSGASPTRIARPVAYFGVFVALLVSILAHVLVPASRTELALKSSEIAQDITSKFLTEGQFLHPAQDVTVYVRRITDLGELQELFLEDARGSEAVITYTSERALLVKADSGPRLVMFNGMAQTRSLSNGSLSTITFEDFAYDIGRLINTGANRLIDLREYSTPVLLDPTPEDLERANGGIGAFLYEAHHRFGRALLAFAAPLLGFSALLLGSFSRFGVWRQILWAVGLIIVIQMISNTSENAAKNDENLFWLAYAAPVTALIFSSIMLKLAAMDRLRSFTNRGASTT